MPRYIDADALKDVIQQHDYPLSDKLNSIGNGMFTLGIFQAIDQMPTISIDEVRGVGISNPFEGVWLPVPDKIGDCLYKCSQCGFVRDAYILDVGNYCPNCGAKMEVAE